MKKYKSLDELPLILKVKDVAEVLSISLNMAYCLVRSGQIRHICMGRSYLIPKAAVLALRKRLSNFLYAQRFAHNSRHQNMGLISNLDGYIFMC